MLEREIGFAEGLDMLDRNRRIAEGFEMLEIYTGIAEGFEMLEMYTESPFCKRMVAISVPSAENASPPNNDSQVIRFMLSSINLSFINVNKFASAGARLLRSL